MGTVRQGRKKRWRTLQTLNIPNVTTGFKNKKIINDTITEASEQRIKGMVKAWER